jgi:predicted nucleic acid-binding protein
VGRLDLLPSLHPQVLIPPAVHAEVTSGGTGALDLAQATWLTVRAPSDTATVARLRRISRLDAGEAEAIVLAGELGARLIVDEHQGRQIARARGIPIVGTIGLIIEASRADLIPVNDVEPLLRQMTGARFRVSERLIRHAVALVRAER